MMHQHDFVPHSGWPQPKPPRRPRYLELAAVAIVATLVALQILHLLIGIPSPAAIFGGQP